MYKAVTILHLRRRCADDALARRGFGAGLQDFAAYMAGVDQTREAAGDSGWASGPGRGSGVSGVLGRLPCSRPPDLRAMSRAVGPGPKGSTSSQRTRRTKCASATSCDVLFGPSTGLWKEDS